MYLQVLCVGRDYTQKITRQAPVTVKQQPVDAYIASLKTNAKETGCVRFFFFFLLHEKAGVTIKTSPRFLNWDGLASVSQTSVKA